MKYCAFIFILAVTAFGWVDEDGRDSSIPDGVAPTGNDGIVLSCSF